MAESLPKCTFVMLFPLSKLGWDIVRKVGIGQLQ